MLQAMRLPASASILIQKSSTLKCELPIYRRIQLRTIMDKHIPGGPGFFIHTHPGLRAAVLRNSMSQVQKVRTASCKAIQAELIVTWPV